MVNPLEKGKSANLPSEETTPQEEPLGIKNPLVSSTPLGQRFLSPKFLLPLGSRPLSTFDFSTFSSDSTLVQGFLNEALSDSPFLNESPPIAGSASLTLPQPIVESASAENATTFSTLVQPSQETSSRKPQENPPSNFTTAVPQQEIVVQRSEVPRGQPNSETSSGKQQENPPGNFTTAVPQQEIVVQRSEVRPRQPSGDTSSLEPQENPPSNLTTAIPGQEIVVQRSEVPPGQSSPETSSPKPQENSPGNFTTAVPQQEIVVQRTEAPAEQTSGDTSSVKPQENPPDNFTTAVPQQEIVVQRTEAPVEQPSGETSSVKKQENPPENFTTEVSEQKIVVQRTEVRPGQPNSETLPPESQGNAPRNLIKLDESASEKRHELESAASDSETKAISSSSQIQSFADNSLIQKATGVYRRLQDGLKFRGQRKAAEVTKSVTEDSLAVQRVEKLTPDAGAIASSTQIPSATQDSLAVQRVEKLTPDAGAIASSTLTPSATQDALTVQRVEASTRDAGAIASSTQTPSATQDALAVHTSQASEAVSKLIDTTHTDHSLIQRKTDTQTPAPTSKQTLEEVTLTTTEPSSISESISEVTAPANQTVAQLLSENGETHQLPRVLENLATTKHLGVSQPLVQHSEFLRATAPIESSNNPKTNRETLLTTNQTRDSDNKSFAADITGRISKQGQVIQRQIASQPTAEIPESWSSIEELLGENHPSPSESEPVVVQAFAEGRHSATENQQLSQNESNIRTSMLLPSAIREAKNLKTSNFSGQSAYGQKPMQKSTQVSTKLKEAISIRKKESDKSIPAQNIEPIEEENLSQESVERDENKYEKNVSDHLDALAREIYTLVRHRLEIERERHHGLYYSGRLPW